MAEDTPSVKVEPPTTETTTEKHETTKTVGETGQAPPPAIIADDAARKYLAVAVIIQFLVFIGFILYAGRPIDNMQLLIGAEITFVTTVLNYYFGSSSGSTATRAVLNKKADL